MIKLGLSIDDDDEGVADDDEHALSGGALHRARDLSLCASRLSLLRLRRIAAHALGVARSTRGLCLDAAGAAHVGRGGGVRVVLGFCVLWGRAGQAVLSAAGAAPRV